MVKSVSCFIDYNVAQIYFDNRDWPGNNIKFWRPKTKDGKWRWLLYDTDWGFGVNAYGNGGNQYGYEYNTLEFATSPTQTPNHHANPPWSTLLLRKLLENDEFKYDFINRFAIFYLAILDSHNWSKGYGSEATMLMVNYAFQTLNLNRIQLHVCAENISAIKIYQKVGFVKEGVLRQAMYRRGGFVDFWVMGILKEEWGKAKR